MRYKMEWDVITEYWIAMNKDKVTRAVPNPPDMGTRLNHSCTGPFCSSLARLCCRYMEGKLTRIRTIV